MRYQITNNTSGADMGVFEAGNKAEALACMRYEAEHGETYERALWVDIKALMEGADAAADKAAFTITEVAA